MLRPVRGIAAAVTDRISAVEHHVFADVNADVRDGKRGVVRPGEENQIAGSGVRGGYGRTDVVKSLRPKAVLTREENQTEG